jgi:hypothetical protein
VSVSAPASGIDREVRELLREDPELLALAELIASLPPGEVAAAAHAVRPRFACRAPAAPAGSRQGRRFG